jgi:hypothetical protein
MVYFDSDVTMDQENDSMASSKLNWKSVHESWRETIHV